MHPVSIYPLLADKFPRPQKFPWVPSCPGKPPQLDPYSFECNCLRFAQSFSLSFLDSSMWFAGLYLIAESHSISRRQWCIHWPVHGRLDYFQFGIINTLFWVFFFVEITCSFLLGKDLKVEFLSHKKGVYWSLWETIRSFCLFVS